MTHFSRFLVRLHENSKQTCLISDDRSYTYQDLLVEYDQWRKRLDINSHIRSCVVGLRADYSLSAIAALLALWERRSVAALIPRDPNPTDYLQDACAVALLDIGTDGHYQWLHSSHASSHPLLERLRDTDDGGIVIFTSGSTGRPKAALQSVEGFFHKFEKPGRTFRTLAFLLFDHVGGLDTLFYTLSYGGTLIVTRRRDPGSVLQLIESQEVEVLPASPSFLRLLCKTISRGSQRGPSLRIITYGAELMDTATLRRVNELFPDVQISQKYGTTETGSPRTISRGNDSLWLKIGQRGVETKVVDGILWIRSQGAMLGYLNAISDGDTQGWHCTGDLVDVDGDWIRFRGRLTDTINVGGEKVSPTEIEQLILQLDFVTDALASGTPHELLGQVVTAEIVLAPGAPDAKEAIRQIRSYCRQHLPAYKVPMKIDVVPTGFASERQKVKRNSHFD